MSKLKEINEILKISEDGKTVLGMNDEFVTSIEIPEGIEVIGEKAFQHCSILMKVTIPESVKFIRGGAFLGCKLLYSINLPLQLKEIEDCVFSQCEHLESIDIPCGVERIGTSAFAGCSSLKNVILPSSLKTISNRAFSDCNSLERIIIPGTVKDVNSEDEFYMCEKIKSIELEEGIESMNSPFHGCTSVKTIKIPNSLKEFGGTFFDSFKSLKKIIISNNHPYFVFTDNVLYSKDKKRIVFALKSIGPHFDVPKSVKKIDKGAFYGCTRLEEITFHDNVSSIGHHAFWGCKRLKKIVLPSKLRKLEDFTFVGCTSLHDVILPSGLKTIGWRAFGGCKSLHHIHIPKSVIKFDTTGWDLQEYTVCPENKHFATIDGVLYNKDFTKLIAMPPGRKYKIFCIPESVTEIGREAFCNCKNLWYIVILDSVKKIGISAFYGCSSLKEIYFPEGIRTIPEKAFNGCKALKSIRLPNTLKRINDSAFCGCENLTSILIPPSVKYVGVYAWPYDLRELHISYKDPRKGYILLHAVCCYSDEFTIFVPKELKEIYENDIIYKNYVIKEEEQ